MSIFQTRRDFLQNAATGLGAMTPFIATGTLPTDVIWAAAQPTLTVGGVPAAVLFGGMSGCCVGLNQINFSVPTGAATGNAVPVVVSMGNAAASGAGVP